VAVPSEIRVNFWLTIGKSDLERVKSRLVSGFAKAKIVYYMQQIDREDVPSLGLALVIQQQLHQLLGIGARAPVKEGSRTVQVLYIVRTDSFRGRIIVNYDELSRALSSPELFPDTKFNIRRHMPQTPVVDALRLYAESDIIIGPHGAGKSCLPLVC
jgi:hypothetical protein